MSRGIFPPLRRLLPQVPLALFLGIFVVFPLGSLILSAVASNPSFVAWMAALWGPGLEAQLARRALENSLVQGSLSAALAWAWGYPVGLFLGRSRGRAVRWAQTLLLVPFVLPSLVVIVGVQDLFGSGGLASSMWGGLAVLGTGLPAILLVNVLFNASMVVLYTAASLRAIPVSREWAVRTAGGGPWRVFRDVWLRPTFLASGLGALLTFLLSFLSFAPPLILGGPSYYTVEDWIYALDKITILSGTPAATILAAWTLILLALPVGLYIWVTHRTGLGGLGGGPDPSDTEVSFWGQSSSLVLGSATAVLVSLELALIFAIVGSSFYTRGSGWSLSNWDALISSRVLGVVGVPLSTVLVNTLLFAGLATGIVVLLTALAALSDLETTLPGRTLALLTFLPLLVSPVILALSLSTAYATSLELPPTLWLLIVGSQACFGIPFVLQTLQDQLRFQEPRAWQAARVLGASSERAHFEVRLPMAREALRGGVAFALAIGLGEFTATNFLYIPRYTTVVVEMYLLDNTRLLGGASALGALLALLSLVVFGALGLRPLRRQRP